MPQPSNPKSAVKLQPYLEEGETLIWAGQTVQGWRANPHYRHYAMRMVIGGGGVLTCILWTLQRWMEGGHWLLIAFGLALTMVMIRVFLGDPLPNMVWRAFMHIGLTNRRLLMLNSGWPVRFRAWRRSELPRPRAAMGRPKELALFWGTPKKSDVPEPLLLYWDNVLPEHLDAGWEPDPEPEERVTMRRLWGNEAPS